MFSHGSSSSTSLAIVTPSLVMVGAPHFLSRTTLWPFGPSVSATVSASLLTPVSSERRASSLNFSSFDAIGFPLQTGEGPAPMRPTPDRTIRVLLGDNGEHVAGREDQVLLALDLDLGAAVLGVDDLVPDLDVEGDAGAVLEPAGAHRHDGALLGLLLGRVRDDDPGDRRLLLFARLDHDAVLERLQTELRHPFLLALSRARSGVSTQPM